MKIYSNNLFYNALRRYVMFVYRFAFSKIDIIGRENIPQDGAVIFAPNHTNAFMDAFSVLKIARKAVVFVARADVFRNPVVAKLFNFFKIMPIMRMRDGRENLKKNDKIMQSAVEVLKAGVPFGIFCEGTHRMKHSILPLVKGIFRIAIQADEALNGEIPVYIVPVGIEYGSYTHYRSTISVQIGEAFNVTEFQNQNKDKTQPELMNIMRDQLSCRISSLYHCVPDNEDYAAILDYSYLHNREILRQMNLKPTPYNVMLANQASVKYIQQLQQQNPTEYQHLISKMYKFATLRRKLNISDETLYNYPTNRTFVIRILTLIITLPYFLFCAIIDLPVSLITWLLFHFIIEDGAMKNSLRLVIIILFYPFIFAILGVMLFSNMHWFTASILFFLALPANLVVHDYVKIIRILKSDYIYLKNI